MMDSNNSSTSASSRRNHWNRPSALTSMATTTITASRLEAGILPAAVTEASSFRLRWTADLSDATREWVFGLDNVELSFLMLGDFDADGKLTAADIDILSAAVRGENAVALHDLNADGQVDLVDRVFWVRELGRHILR